MSSVAVIGSGFSGLSAAACLAKEGFQVTILEKNGSPGGRARKFEAEGFVFDMGPSWYWMPDVFEKFYNQFGKSASDFYELKRIDPSYRIFYAKDDILDVPAGVEPLCEMFERRQKGSGDHLRKFLQEARYKYEAGIHGFAYKPGLSILELMDARFIKGFFGSHIFQSFSSHVRRNFRDLGLIQLLEFPALFLGATPARTPALYSLMNYADMALGTWYPMGGMHKIVEAMESIARTQGVEFQFNNEVQGIEVDGQVIQSLKANGVSRKFDYVVASADYHQVEQVLLPVEHRTYTEKYWEQRKMAPSALIYYLGVNKRLKNLLHHNLFFDQDFGTHAKEIYEHPSWPANPLFYVCCPSLTDSSVAPSGSENLFILIPLAPGMTDTEEIRTRYFNLVMDRMESLTGQTIRENIVFKKSYAPCDFERDYHAFKGNAYGLANTIMQTAHLKPSIVSKKVKNLFYCGQLTVPGPGVPPSIISGQVVAQELIRRDKSLRQENTH